MGEINFYKVKCSKISCEVGVAVSFRWDVVDGCPCKGYRGIPWCPAGGCLPGEFPENSIIAISLKEYGKLGKRFPDIY